LSTPALQVEYAKSRSLRVGKTELKRLKNEGILEKVAKIFSYLAENEYLCSPKVR
jgi:hypothetical protein